MLRTHLSSHTLMFCLALAVVSGACSSSGDSTPSPSDTDLDSHSEGGGGNGPGEAGSSSDAGTSSGDAGEASLPEGSAGSAPEETAGGSANGGSANGGSANGGSANGGSANGGSANGGSANGGRANGGSAGVAGSATHGNPAIARGQALATKNMCTTCHQQDYSGLAIYPNLTPDLDTGIGSWSDQEISAAVREQKGKDNATLCNLMVPFPFSNAEVADLVAFLRSLPAVSNQIEQACPGHVP